jgi:flagellar protein FliS
MSTAAVPKSYRKTQILTASPVELMLMLYEAAIAACEQARDRINARDYESSHVLLVRAENIVSELSAGLRRDVHPELVSNLARLLEFVFYRLFEANLSRGTRCIDEALMVLTTLRDGWREAAGQADDPAGDEAMGEPHGGLELSA